MRVNVETRGIKRALKLSKILKISHQEALGHLVLFWEASQDEEAVEAEGSDICLWFDPTEKWEPKKLLDALKDSGFISANRRYKNRFKIHGNASNVAALTQRRQSAKAGGKASAVSRRNKKKLKRDSNLGSTENEIPFNRDPDPVEPKPNQTKPLQTKPKQTYPNGHSETQIVYDKSALAETANAVARRKVSSGKKTSELYRLLYGHYKTKHNAPLSKDGKTFGIIKRLLKSYTVAELDRLFQIYLQIDDPFFKKRHWDLVAFEQGLQKILVAAVRGADPDDDLASLREKYREKESADELGNF